MIFLSVYLLFLQVFPPSLEHFDYDVSLDVPLILATALVTSGQVVTSCVLLYIVQILQY